MIRHFLSTLYGVWVIKTKLGCPSLLVTNLYKPPMIGYMQIIRSAYLLPLSISKIEDGIIELLEYIKTFFILGQKLLIWPKKIEWVLYHPWRLIIFKWEKILVRILDFQHRCVRANICFIKHKASVTLKCVGGIRACLDRNVCVWNECHASLQCM